VHELVVLFTGLLDLKSNKYSKEMGAYLGSPLQKRKQEANLLPVFLALKSPATFFGPLVLLFSKYS
jgi:hypothetical protein